MLSNSCQRETASNNQYLKTGEKTPRLTDVTGRLLQLGKAQVLYGATNLEVDVAKLNLAPGIYFLRVSFEDNKTETVKLIIYE